jgi:alpha-tubulin suppressor-like RCC1 family protein
MKPTNTVVKLFSSVSTLAVVAGATAFNSVAWGDGAVLAWGAGTTNQNDDGTIGDFYGQCIIPDSAKSGVTAIASGTYHTIALKDGAVLAWGAGTTNQPSGNFIHSGQCIIPDSAKSGVTAIAGGYAHTIALKNGEVLAWGLNNQGQCNIPVDALSGVTAIAGGYGHIIALKDGAVLAWGRNSDGQCTIPASATSGVSAIACGKQHTIALKGGAVMAWGANWYGQRNIPVDALSGVSAIAGGGYAHTIALKNGAVLAWGQNGSGQCTIPASALSGVSAIAGGETFTVALKDGAVLAWGENYYGQCNIPVDALSGVSAIAGGYGHIIALTYMDPNDTDGDGIPNITDNCPNVKNPTQADCDGNGVGDACELDCNRNGIADICEMLSGAVTDQNLNGIPDTCEVSSVSRVLPISGPSTGGTAVRIIGTNFFSALPVSVTFGGAPATNVVVVSLTEITAVTPAGSPGDTFVAVNGAGAEEFYYRPSCDGDLDNNGTIDGADVGIMLINYGNCYESAATAPKEPMIFPIEAAKPGAVKK